MTIFQKMILVPVLSLIVYGGFIVFSFIEQQRSTRNVEQLRDDYMPVLVMVKENLRRFKELRDAFKDAVIAGERRWVADTLVIKERIDESLVLLEQYPHIIGAEKLVETRRDFGLYYNNARALADNILKHNEQWDADDKLVKNVEKYLTLSSQNFLMMEQHVQASFKQTIDHTNRMLGQLLFWGGIISGSSMLFLLVVTLMVSVGTRRNIFQLVARTKALAEGKANFSKRLERPQEDELGKLIYWFNRLSDKLEADYLQLQEVSITDKLTQLNNRTRTDQYLPGAIAQARKLNVPLHLVIIDIDHFKSINDTFGHLAGDRVLRHFAELLKSHATTNDFIGRWGGEEFVLVWSNTDRKSAMEKAEKLRSAVEKSLFPDVGKLTASFGMAQAEHTDSLDALILRADTNLYMAKEQGRNRVVGN